MPNRCLRAVIPSATIPTLLFLLPGHFADRRSRPTACRTPRLRPLLCGGIAIVLLIVSGVAYAETVAAKPLGSAAASDPFAAFVAEASQRFGIPAPWIRAVMQVESVNTVRALSPKGAMGLMQIMPQTWSGLRLRYGLGANPYDLVDPKGALERRNRWEKTSHSLLVGTILHVLYAEPDKTLAGVANFLSDPSVRSRRRCAR